MRVRIRPRWTIGTLMILVAAGALAFAVVQDVRHRPRRDDCAWQEQYLRGQVAFHGREAVACRLKGDAPYDYAEREPVQAAVPYQAPRFKSWAEEAAWHEESRVDRLFHAENYALGKQIHERYLLFR